MRLSLRPGRNGHAARAAGRGERPVAVIGAGVGGIAAAAHLARLGQRVHVFEKNGRPGGRLDHFWRDGHHFDTGPTLLVLPLVYRQEFAALGASLAQSLDLVRIDPTYRLVFDDGSQLALTSEEEPMRRQLETIEAGSFAALHRYLEDGARDYAWAMSNLVEREPRLWADVLSPRALTLLRQARAFLPHYRHMQAYFDDPRLKAAFTFQDIYMGLSPFEAPALFSMMPFSELVHGVFFPRGGMYRIVEALMTIAREAGVEFHFHTPVRRIATQSASAEGLVLEDGRTFEAQAVIANADLPYVYQQLLPADGQAARLARLRYSCSVISFFWGIDRPVESVGPHTLFLADDYAGNFDSLDRRHTLPDNPSVYVHAPAHIDPSLAPPGQDTLTAIVPVGHLDDDHPQDWPALRARARRAVLQRLAELGEGDLEAHIKFEANYTPLSWRRRYNLVRGSTHGLSHTLTQMAYFRPANRHPQLRNVYFVGASTHPGTGVPTALISARLTAERLLRERA
ncbi:MAG TPA: phytoene desaturase family protein [Anaerolineales bacterium]|nr:phytoene desaturase family protein [Anaerolineales bacterium]